MIGWLFSCCFTIKAKHGEQMTKQSDKQYGNFYPFSFSFFLFYLTRFRRFSAYPVGCYTSISSPWYLLLHICLRITVVLNFFSARGRGGGCGGVADADIGAESHRWSKSTFSSSSVPVGIGWSHAIFRFTRRLWWKVSRDSHESHNSRLTTSHDSRHRRLSPWSRTDGHTDGRMDTPLIEMRGRIK